MRKEAISLRFLCRYLESDLVKLDIILSGSPVDFLTLLLLLITLHFCIPCHSILARPRSRKTGCQHMQRATPTYPQSLCRYQESDLVKLDILLNGSPVDALASIVHRSKSQRVGRELVEKLKKLIDRQMFEVSYFLAYSLTYASMHKVLSVI